MRVNIRLLGWRVLRGSLGLDVGYRLFLSDVHFFVLVFLHPFLLGFGEALWIVLLEFFLSSLSDLGRTDGGERRVRRVLSKQVLEHFSELILFSTQWKDTEEYNYLRTRVHFRFLLIFHF